MKALIVREPWVTQLVEGDKAWELRSRRTAHRGRTALVASGTGHLIGEATLVDVVGPLSAEVLAGSSYLHRVPPSLLARLAGRTVYAWRFERPVRYATPVSYRHPRGAVTWVNINPAILPLEA